MEGMANKELWEQLGNESPRQFEGLKAFRGLPPKDRNLINSWRVYSENDSAPKVPPRKSLFCGDFVLYKEWVPRNSVAGSPVAEKG